MCGLIVLAVGLVLAPSALASTGVRHAALGSRHAAAPAGAALRALGADPTYYSISGNVYDYDGNAVAGAAVDWGWWDTTGYNFGGTNAPTDSSPGTDGSGYFAFPAVTSAPGDDDLTVGYPLLNPAPAPDLYKLETWSNNFSTVADYPLRPGKADLTVVGLSDALANGAAAADVLVAGTPGIAETGVTLNAGAGVAFVAPTSFNDVTLGFFDTRYGMTAVTQTQVADTAVTAGSEDTSAVSLDWTAAHHAYLAGPVWQHSGKPGGLVRLTLKGWPDKEQADFYFRGPTRDWGVPGSWTSTGAAATVSLRFPTKAPIGVYEVHAYRFDLGDANGLPDLWDMYQVCTFKASAGVIHHGRAIRLSGRVPGSGSAIVYSTTHKVTGQPGTLAAKGWVRGGHYHINAKTGAFLSGLLHPKRTTYYVVKYAGADFNAFTQVVKVVVH
jgi:hypothetical protein